MTDTHLVRHIAIEGVIGAGKTSLVHLLASDLNARKVLEIVEENPFLTGGFYLDRARFAFDTQMFFLLSRLRQQREIQRLLADGEARVLADYTMDKDNIFASLTLESDDYALYSRVFRAFRAELPTPDLVIYLRAPTDVLLGRIRRRDRVFERTIEEAYIEDLNRAYERYFSSFAGPAHVTLDVSQLDWVGSPGDYEVVRRLVTQTVGNIAAGQGTFDFVSRAAHVAGALDLEGPEDDPSEPRRLRGERPGRPVERSRPGPASGGPAS